MNVASDPRITTERNGHVLIVRIARPEVRNAIDGDMGWAINDAWDQLEGDPELRVGIITGTQGVFTAGADLKAARSPTRALPPRGKFGICKTPPGKPLVAAIEGFALGGGLEIALACDLIVAAKDARFGLPEVRRGVVAAAGGAFRLPRRLPYAVAVEMALTGEHVEAGRLAAFGLINRLTAPGEALATALEIARTISANGPLAVAATLQIMRASRDWKENEAWEAQVPMLEKVRTSQDWAEGLKAFAEKREPRWTGR